MRRAKTSQRVFGAIPGVPVGKVFVNRRALHDAKVHRPLQAGISGAAKEGADSIVISGGYEDDIDNGGEIYYTGHGGNDPETAKQVESQELHRGNLALVRSCERSLPVRVVRGANARSSHAPQSGYRYDGLYVVQGYSQVIGRSGHKIWRFHLVRSDLD
jgi:putative restriction endonuclease